MVSMPGWLYPKKAATQAADPKLELFKAIEAGNVGVVTKLLAQGVSPIIMKDRWGDTPLHAAARSGKLAIVKLLLAHGVSPNLRDLGRETPLHKAARFGRADVVEFLLSKGAKPNVQNNTDRKTPLHLAAWGAYARIVKLLLSKGAKPNVKDGYGDMPLYLAARQNSPAVVKLLLAYGANPNIKNAEGETSLHGTTTGGLQVLSSTMAGEERINPYYIPGGKVNTIKLLLGKGANPNIQDKRGSTPLHGLTRTWAREFDDGGYPESPKIRNIAVKSYTGAIKLLLGKGADPNIKDNKGKTPYDFATNRTKGFLKKLLKKSKK